MSQKILKQSWQRQESLAAIAFLLPAFSIFAIFVLFPIAQSARYSLHTWNGLGPLTAENFNQFNNYVRLLQDPIFWRALFNNALVILWSLATQIPLAIGLAILLTSRLHGSTFFRTIYFAPMILSEVMVATIWSWIYHPSFGLLNTFLRSLQLDQFALPWLGESQTAFWAVLVVTTWKYLGFYMVIYIAAIQGIPEELYEAARIDGAGAWQLHRFITLPMLTSTTRVAVVLVIVGSLKFFDIVWVLTEGGPYNSTEVVATYMYKQAFRSQDWGYGSALAFSLFAITFVVASTLIISSRRQQR